MHQFKRMEDLLEQSKESPDDFNPSFESEFEAMIWNNYFLPKDLLNSQNNDLRNFKFCKTCDVYKMPRTHHCSMCNRCCIKYDHHCGLAINCIGYNNYPLFIVFLISTVTVRPLSSK